MTAPYPTIPDLLKALLLALIAFIPVGMKLLETSRKQVKLQANANAQAVNMARAGLTDADVVRIRNISGMTRRAMAALFGVSHGTINRIINRRGWKHIPPGRT